MQDYVVSYPAELDSKISEIAIKIQSLWVKGDFSAAEKLLKQQYELILTYERKLPEGKRHHKGAPLHNWGIAVLLQRDHTGSKKAI